ncbi:queuosine 5'-phosphate N-glycosylase/hydrolase [Tengunoibacter tsumagoiensis]|uniref:Queuosine 5'-phosphate N-glycosylase/hydrolase n=1 Tax=Tengunoibacter tsumagoiensis TaxID=2014871 RepID=A0A401ZZ29_9CHLR|nr:queuosine salvage family protein [Tengunoibacter tsumagoiensis]GCE12095.1 hypothetical protein KTT_19540 [Tengunoibacter tsumagoiensis]
MDNLHRHDEDDDLYTLPGHDPLGVLSSTQVVVEQGELVWINPDQIEQLCERWLHDAPTTASPQWFEQYHFTDGTQRTVNWLLLLDALNFCFWAEKGQPRWTIEYQGERLNGYWAEAAALKRAVEEGHPLWDAEYLRQMSAETLAQIFRGEQKIPLFDERLAHTHEVGRILQEQFSGQFSNAIEQSQHSAVTLALLLAQHFPSFHDVATYHGKQVRFLKRAQICVADLSAAFHGEGWGRFTDLGMMTIFADYKLPQVLRHYGVLTYHTSLAQRVDTQELIPAGSEEEIEIRACTIWACELLRRAMERRGSQLTAADIDLKLWLIGQNAKEMRPYHRTRTVYY